MRLQAALGISDSNFRELGRARLPIVQAHEGPETQKHGGTNTRYGVVDFASSAGVAEAMTKNKARGKSAFAAFSQLHSH